MDKIKLLFNNISSFFKLIFHNKYIDSIFNNRGFQILQLILIVYLYIQLDSYANSYHSYYDHAEKNHDHSDYADENHDHRDLERKINNLEMELSSHELWGH